MTSATNTKQIKARKDLAKLDGQVERAVIERLMVDIQGRRWIHLQLEFAQMYDGNGNLDPYYMAFEKGRRNTGLKLLQAVQRYAPHHYVIMLEENSGVKLIEEEEDGRYSDSGARDPFEPGDT